MFLSALVEEKVDLKRTDIMHADSKQINLEGPTRWMAGIDSHGRGWCHPGRFFQKRGPRFDEFAADRLKLMLLQTCGGTLVSRWTFSRLLFQKSRYRHWPVQTDPGAA